MTPKERHKLYLKEYYQKNKEKAKAYAREYRKKHYQKCIEYNRKYHRDNREKVTAKQAEWRRNNPERVAIYKQRANEKRRKVPRTCGDVPRRKQREKCNELSNVPASNTNTD